MTSEERKASIEATATERASTLTPLVHHQTLAELHKRVAELEGKPSAGDPTNEFHLAGNALREAHGEAKARLIEKLTLNNVVESGSVPLFIKYLDEYTAEIVNTAVELHNYPIEAIWAEVDRRVADSSIYGSPNIGSGPQTEFEQAASDSTGVDVRPSEEKENG